MKEYGSMIVRKEDLKRFVKNKAKLELKKGEQVSHASFFSMVMDHYEKGD